MGYTETLLASGERMVRLEHQHPFILIWNARWAVGALIAAIVLVMVRVAVGGGGLLLDILGFVTFVLFVYGLVFIGWGYLRYLNEQYVITSRRIIHASGVINKSATDSSLEKINDAILTETLFGRMFGFGDLDVLTASETGIERLRMLRNAKDFKKAMLEAKHELELELTRPTMPPLRTTPEPAPTPAASPAAPAPAAAPTSLPAPEPPAAAPAATSSQEVTEALAQLGVLRNRGIVTDEEFEAKKRELLGRL